MGLRTVCRVMAIALTAAGAASAAEAGAAGPEPFPVDGLEPTVLRIVEFIRATNDGRAEEAVGLVEAMCHPKRTTPGKMFAFHKQAVAEYARIATQAPDFESVEFVGVRRLSSGACYLYLVAHSHFGPALFEFKVYRHRDEWYCDGMSWSLAFSDPTRGKEYTPFERPVAYPLRSARPPVEASRPPAPGAVAAAAADENPFD